MEKYLLINDIEEKEARSIFEWIDSLQDGGTAVLDIISHGGQAPTAQLLKEALKAQEGQSDEGAKADVSVTAEDAIQNTQVVPESITPLDGVGIPVPSRRKRMKPL